MSKRLRSIAASVLMAATFTGLVAVAQESANIVPYFVNPVTAQFVRQPDTTCACVSDTTMGPSVFVYGAREVLLRLQANSGTCSTVTFQASNNDTNWVTPSNVVLVSRTTFAVGDSLNQGGAMFRLIPRDSIYSAPTIQYRYIRSFVRQRAGVTSNNDCTILCRAKVDSLRWKYYVVKSAP